MAGEVREPREVGGGGLVGLGQQHGRLEPLGARGDRHTEAHLDRRQPERRQVDRGGGVRAAVGVPDGRTLGGADPGPGGGAGVPPASGPRARGQSWSLPSSRCAVAGSTRLISTVPILLRRPAARSASKRRPWASTCEPGIDATEVLGHQAADAVDVLLLDVEAEQLVEVVDRVARGDPGGARREHLDLDLLLVVLMSVISPTISSRMSSIVIRPAVPPYSSTTTSMCCRLACISESSASTGLESGTKWAGRITSSMRWVASTSGPRSPGARCP